VCSSYKVCHTDTPRCVLKQSVDMPQKLLSKNAEATFIFLKEN
jgi:hypothetical protein